MNRFFSVMALIFAFGLVTVSSDAEAAKRLGGGKSMGAQRQAAPDKTVQAPPAAATPAAAGGAAAAGSRSWMGPVAGIAAGLGLAALASHMGFGEELASFLLMGLVVVAVMVAIGFFMRKRASTQTGPHGYQHAHAGAAARHNRPLNAANAAYGAPAHKVLMPATGGGSQIGSAIGSGLSSGGQASRIPADFDRASFERNAKLNFVRLQAANDTGDVADIRQFTTPELFTALASEISQRGATVQRTEVLQLDAEVVDVEEGFDQYVVSVRFTGTIRDADTAQEESVDEIWHLTKPRQGSAGWLLDGIQQAN